MSFFRRAAVFGGLSAVLLYVLPSPPRVTLFSKEDRLNTQTTFYGFNKCSQGQADTIKQAHLDALALAEAALEDDRELATTSVSQYIDFNSLAAIEYFGPPERNAKWQQYIFDTFYRATKAYRGWGFSDWWYKRYIEIKCGQPGPDDDCHRTYAYTDLTYRGRKIPSITYCPLFFENLDSHADTLNRVKNAGPDARKNALQMTDQGAVAFHEWLHIADSPAEICQGGCIDVAQLVRGERHLSYRPGMSKLLASRDTGAAARNNENYVYFAISKQMEKEFGEYPVYPKGYDYAESYRENKRREKEEPGYKYTSESMDRQPVEGDEVISAPLYPESDYPSWYRSMVERKRRIDAPNLSEHFHTALNLSRPHIHDVICETTRHSGSIRDCVNAFENLYANPEAPAKKGRTGDWNWEGYTGSCALAVNYTGDWTNCEATLGDIRAHASTIFEACQDGCRHAVAGHVPFSRIDCPGTISIIPTEDRRPPGERLYTFIVDLLKGSRLFNWKRS